MGIISQLQALYDYMDGKLTLDEALSNMRDGGTFMTDIEIKTAAQFATLECNFIRAGRC